MSIIYPILLVIHVLFSLALIIAVLMQSSKGEGLAGAFGGGALTGAVFGGRGAATFLSKATTVLAVGFMSTSVLLFVSFGIRSTGGPESGVLENLQEGSGVATPPPQPTTVPGEAQPTDNQGAADDLFQQIEREPAADTSGN
jgi:preprotein translocase subunit SecG